MAKDIAVPMHDTPLPGGLWEELGRVFGIPIVFAAAEDPVKVGLVGNLARPGGNMTVASILFAELGQKQLGLLRELVSTAARIGLLINPNNVMPKT